MDWKIYRGKSENALTTYVYLTEYSKLAFAVAGFRDGSAWRGDRPIGDAASQASWRSISFEQMRRVVWTAAANRRSDTTLRFRQEMARDTTKIRGHYHGIAHRRAFRLRKREVGEEARGDRVDSRGSGRGRARASRFALRIPS